MTVSEIVENSKILHVPGKAAMLLKIRYSQHNSGERDRDLNLFGEGGREHHGLPLSHGRHRVLLHNPPDLRLEPHVQHPVRLVQNQVSGEKRGEFRSVTF